MNSRVHTRTNERATWRRANTAVGTYMGNVRRLGARQHHVIQSINAGQRGPAIHQKESKIYEDDTQNSDGGWPDWGRNGADGGRDELQARRNGDADDAGDDSGGKLCPKRGGNATFDVNGATHQLNVAPGAWSGFPFGEWWYLEINQQERAGLRPGQRQEAVTLTNPTLTLENLPDGVTAITAGVASDSTDGADVRADDKMTALTTFPVKNGRVDMRIKEMQWAQRFGAKQWALWFKTTGGQNFIGQFNVRLTLRGKVANGSHIKIAFVVVFGVNPPPTPVPPTPGTPGGYMCGGKTWTQVADTTVMAGQLCTVPGPGLPLTGCVPTASPTVFKMTFTKDTPGCQSSPTGQFNVTAAAESTAILPTGRLRYW